MISRRICALLVTVLAASGLGCAALAELFRDPHDVSIEPAALAGCSGIEIIRPGPEYQIPLGTVDADDLRY